jgi:hypothetical protein
VLNVLHNTDFTDIATPLYIDVGGDLTMQFTAFGPHAGQLFELKVVNEDGSEVGYYRLGQVPNSGNFLVRIPDIIMLGEQYDIDYYADFNGDGSYDDPPVDHAWRDTATGAAGGINLTITHNTDFTDIDF